MTRSGRPSERRVRIWFERRFSIIAARVMREMTAICGSASTITGQDEVAHRTVRPTADGQPGEGQAEDDLEDRRDHEVRDRKPERADARHQVIDAAVLAHGRDGAERAADEDSEGKRQRAERHRDRQAAGEQLADGEVAQEKRGPKSPRATARQIEPVLLDQRLVELIDPVEIFHHLRLERTFEVERSSGREADQEERDRDDDEQRRDGRQKPANDEGEHEAPPAVPMLKEWGRPGFAGRPRLPVFTASSTGSATDRRRACSARSPGSSARSAGSCRNT